MLEIATLATASYYPNAARLARSLMRTQPRHRLRLYCDDVDVFGDLARETGCRLVPFPDLRRLGAYRAKPRAWAHALQEGPFLYLDSDIIALEPLDAGFPDDLVSASPDPAPAALGWGPNPWPRDPGLACRSYVNTGVVHFPAFVAGFLAELASLAEDEEAWRRWNLRFHDQDVFNALANLRDLPLAFLDPRVWNFDGFLTQELMRQWQHGFRGPIPPELLLVERLGLHLCSLEDGRVLKLVHLAGIRQRSAFLGLLPRPVRELLELRSL